MASFTTSALPAGPHAITASYSGNAAFLASVGVGDPDGRHDPAHGLGQLLERFAHGRAVGDAHRDRHRGGAMPTGSVTFFAGLTSLGSAP